VLIADDHESARHALRSVLAREPDLDIVGEAGDGHEAVELAERLRPDLILMDVRMPELDGLSATEAIIAMLPAARVVVVTSLENQAYAVEALRLGATGYLLKGATKDEVLATLRASLGRDRPGPGHPNR
jgi:DNA-binding NarL/FixJ family response regulator